MTVFRVQSVVYRVFFFGSLIVLPFIQFLVKQRYFLMRAENVVYMAFLVAACLILGWITHKHMVFHVVAILGLSVMQVPYTQSIHDALLVFKPIYLVFAAIFLFSALARLMGDKFYAVVLVAVTAANISGMVEAAVGPGVLSITDNPSLSENSNSATHTKPSRVIYLVLDGYMGPAGFAEDTPHSKSVRRSIENTFLKYGFTLYPNAFSNYAWTAASVRSLLNMTLLDRAPVEDPGERYRLFSHFRELGWALSIYRFRNAKVFWTPPSAEREVLYNQFLLGAIRDLPMPWTDRLTVLSRTYMYESRWILLVMKNLDAGWVNIHGLHWSQAVSLKVLDVLRRDVIAASRDSLFFAHLLAPHHPYIYRSDGSVWPVATMAIWRWGRSLDDRAYEAWRRQYEEQVLHLNKRLDEFLGQLQSAGVLASAMVIVHGDHGSRMRSSAGIGEPFQQMLDRYSALLAVKRPGMLKGRMVHRKASLMELLHKELYPDAKWQLPREIDSVYLHDDNGAVAKSPFLSLWRKSELSSQ